MQAIERSLRTGGRCLLSSRLTELRHNGFKLINRGNSQLASYHKYQLTSDQYDLKQTANKFFNDAFDPSLISAVTKTGHWDGMRDFWKQMGTMGFLGVTAPSKYGGLGMGYMEHVLVMEEMSRLFPAIALSYGAHSNLCVNQIASNGNEEQMQKYLPKLIDGTYIGALAMSEVSAGSDVTSMRTTAIKEGDYYVLNGTKFWITNGSVADVILVYAKTSPESITAFLVETNTPGFSVGQKIDKIGMRGSPTAEIIFDSCRVHESQILGQLGRGVYVLMSGLDSERLVLAAGPLGIMQRACEVAFGYVHERKQFGAPVATMQLVQGKMADMYADTDSCRRYLYSVARDLDAYRIQIQGKQRAGASEFTKDCAAVILKLAETATRIAVDAIQLLGGNGYTNDYETGRLLLDAKLYEIGAGTSEIRRWLIGRQLNKDHGVTGV